MKHEDHCTYLVNDTAICDCTPQLSVEVVFKQGHQEVARYGLSTQCAKDVGWSMLLGSLYALKDEHHKVLGHLKKVE